MDSEGQRNGSNPAAMLASLKSKREKLREELRNVEKQVYELETSYLQESSHFGHVLKGFEGLKRSRKFQPEDRLFSLSSVTSPTAEELAPTREDGRSDFGPGRSKPAHMPANGQGKPKKGRTLSAPRDAKKIRASNEAELDDEDDPDMK